MSRSRTRLLAAGLATIVAAAVALPATAPALAGEGDPFYAHGNKEFADVGDPNVFFRVDLTGLPSACREVPPVVDYTLSVTSPGGVLPNTSGTMDTYTDSYLNEGYYEVWLPIENFSAGEVYTLNASTDDGCFDGATFSDSATITINGGDTPEEPGDDGDTDEPYVFDGVDTIEGYLSVQQVAGSTDADDWAAGEGAEVAMFPNGGDGPVDFAVVDSEGYFELTAPVESISDEETDYLVVAVVGDDFYFYEEGAGYENPSTSNEEDATFLAPYQFDGEASYDIFAGTLPNISASVLAKICSYDGEETRDVDTNAGVFWEELCLTDGSIDDAELSYLNDAFDDFGFIAFPATPGRIPNSGDPEDDYFVTADMYSLTETADGVTLVFSDDDVTVWDVDEELVQVDVDVTVVISGAWVRWSASVYRAGTDTLATDVPFYLVGDLGSDGDTAWESNEGIAVSWDLGDGDPLIGHRVVSGFSWQYSDGDDEVSLLAAGSLVYEIALMDWCSGDDPMSDALDAVDGAEFGSALPFLGGDCPAAPSWSIATPTWKVGAAYDRTFTAPVAEPWDWSYGGDIELGTLPAGLEWEVVDRWVEGTPPSVRIFGTPTEAGSFDFWVYLEDDYGNDVEFDVAGIVAAETTSGGGGSDGPLVPEEQSSRDLGLELKIAIGDQIAGAPAEATAEGLEEGADYDIVVRSTPQTLAVGTVPVGGTVSRGITLPTLEAGWHSLTFTSTWAGGGTAVAKLWFQVSADGTLLAISRSAPAGLANTGADIGGSVTLASFALLLGFGMVAFRRRRSARV